jgi:hypothetical protein
MGRLPGLATNNVAVIKFLARANTPAYYFWSVSGKVKKAYITIQKHLRL